MSNEVAEFIADCADIKNVMYMLDHELVSKTPSEDLCKKVSEARNALREAVREL